MAPYGIEQATFRFVAQHLNHCATARNMYSIEINVQKKELCVKLVIYIELYQDARATKHKIILQYNC